MPPILSGPWFRVHQEAARFACPRCGEERRAQRIGVERRLAVLGRPWLRLGRQVRYLTCRTCERTWSEAELSATGDTAVSEDDRAIWSTVARVVFSDSSVRSAELDGVQAAVARFTDGKIDPEGPGSLLRGARSRWGDPLDRLRRLAPVLGDRAKVRIVAAAYTVAAADEEVHPEEGRLLMRIGEALDLTPRAVRDAIREAKQKPNPRS